MLLCLIPNKGITLKNNKVEDIVVKVTIPTLFKIIEPTYPAAIDANCDSTNTILNNPDVLLVGIISVIYNLLATQYPNAVNLRTFSNYVLN